VDITQFERFVGESLADIPEEFRPHLESVQVIVLPQPSRVQRRLMGLRPRDALYGLYEGLTVPERTRLFGEMDGVPPSLITLFRRPLAADFPEPDELRAEVRRTVFHELAHHFGISDERLRELGAY
jgi:predicted Zn-dependent protease with MMP-like domain